MLGNLWVPPCFTGCEREDACGFATVTAAGAGVLCELYSAAEINFNCTASGLVKMLGTPCPILVLCLQHKQGHSHEKDGLLPDPLDTALHSGHDKSRQIGKDAAPRCFQKGRLNAPVVGWDLTQRFCAYNKLSSGSWEYKLA